MQLKTLNYENRNRKKIFKVLLLITLSTQFTYSQKVINLNKCELNNPYIKVTQEALNNTDISVFLKNENTFSKNSSVAEMNYSEINNLSNRTISNSTNIKSLIIKINEDISFLNISLLENFQSLETIHFIIEKELDENRLSSLFNNSNYNWIITYQIEIPQ